MQASTVVDSVIASGRSVEDYRSSSTLIHSFVSLSWAMHNVIRSVELVELGNWKVTKRTGWITLVYERQQHGHKYLLRENVG